MKGVFFKISLGIPHLDAECNDTVILGFMMAQFIADFNHQVDTFILRFMTSTIRDSRYRHSQYVY